MRCPRHPDRPATAECTVCGTRHCEECAPHLAALGGAVCPGCRPAVGKLGVAPAPARRGLGPGGAIAAAVFVTAAAVAGVVSISQQLPGGLHTPDGPLIAETFEALTLVGLAAERHRGATGEWPRSLDALVPSQLSALPPDPFAPERTLRLAPDPLQPEGLVIYSVGPDRSDGRGLPRDPATGQGDLVYPLD